MKKLFGTDGIRGEAGRFPLDAETMRTTARSLARHLAKQTGRAPRIVIGRDTRESGEWIEAALTEGAEGAGATCDLAGVITTPGVAFLTHTLPADAGLVISASHNPFQDNGIKIFAPTGRKFDDATERLIEADIYAARDLPHDDHDPPTPAAGRDPRISTVPQQAAYSADLRNRYLDYLAGTVAGDLRFDGLSIVVDCANGAASEFAPALLRRLGAHVHSINDAPDGRNINLDSGSLHIEGLQRAVVERRATLGVAFDGDADRALFVDARGQFVDGDATLWVLAGSMKAKGILEGDCVVATVMSNIGLELALAARRIELVRADVGDKYVLEELLRRDAALGGEQSGHIIFPRTSLAGDGMITALHLLRAMTETGSALHELTEGFIRYPQILVNVPVRDKRPFADVPEVARRAREIEATLNGSGRLLLRYSGTERLARIMIEGKHQDEIKSLADDLAVVIRESIGTG